MVKSTQRISTNEVREYLRAHPDARPSELAAQFGRSEAHIYALRKQVREALAKSPVATPAVVTVATPAVVTVATPTKQTARVIIEAGKGTITVDADAVVVAAFLTSLL